MTQPANGRNNYTGTGAVFPMPFTFPCPVASHVKVVVASPVSGVESTLVQGIDYLITLTTGGGSITLVAGALALDWKLSILLRPPYLQDSDIKNNASYYRESQEQDHDRRVRQIIALADEVERSLKLPETEVGTPELTKIPSFAQRINKFAYWDGTGALTAVDPPAGGGGGGGGGGGPLNSDYQGALLGVADSTPTDLEIVAMPAQPNVVVGMGLEVEIGVNVPGSYEVTLFADPGRLRSIASYIFDTTMAVYDTTGFGFISTDASGKVYARVTPLAVGGPSNVTLSVKMAAIATVGSFTLASLAAALATNSGLEFVVEGLVSALRAKTVALGGVERVAGGLQSDATVLRTSGLGQTKSDLLTLSGGLKIALSGIVGPPIGGAHTAGEIVADVNGSHWLCTADGTPGVWTFWGSRRQTFTGVTGAIAAGATVNFELATFGRCGQILRGRFWPVAAVASFDVPYRLRFHSKETRLGRDLVKQLVGLYGRKVRNNAAEPLAETSIAVASSGSLMPNDAVFIDDAVGGVSEHNRLADVTITPTLVLEGGLLAAINANSDITTVEEENGMGWWNDTLSAAEKYKLFCSAKNEHASQAITLRYEIEVLNQGSFA